MLYRKLQQFPADFHEIVFKDADFEICVLIRTSEIWSSENLVFLAERNFHTKFSRRKIFQQKMFILLDVNTTRRDEI